MTLATIKQQIWYKCNRNPVTVQVAADKAGVRLPITQVHEAQKLWDSMNKKKVKRKVETPRWCIDRYEQAHREWFAREYPAAYKDGHYAGMEPEFPDLGTSGGLTRFVINHATWMGCHGNRINTTGRQLPSGKWITGTTKTGTSDTILLISGTMCCLEIKVGNDKPSEDQLRQQAAIRRAGGVYEFVSTVEEYFIIFDRYYIRQATLL